MRVIAVAVAGILAMVPVAGAEWIVAVTSDYYMSGNTAVYDTDADVFDSEVLGHADQDVVVKTDGTWVYFIERTTGAISKYDPAHIGPGGLVWQYTVGAGTNPYDMVFADDKAYVICFQLGAVLVVDPDAADQASFVTRAIDISPFYDDSYPEAMFGTVYHGVLFVVMQRLTDQWIAEHSGLLIGIDTATDTVMDADPDDDGLPGIELLVKNPQECVRVSPQNPLLYLCGHVWGQQTEGVQVVDLDELTGDRPFDADAQGILIRESVVAQDITGIAVLDMDTAFFIGVNGSTATWFDPVTGGIGELLPVASPSGAVMVDGIVYVGSRDDASPGICPVDPATNLAGDLLPTTLPPVMMVSLDPDGDVAVMDEQQATFDLGVPSPNPFNPETAIPFSIADSGRVTVEVYNLLGQRVATLFDRILPAGSHRVVWRAGNVASGAYVVRVTAGGMARTARVTLLR